MTLDKGELYNQNPNLDLLRLADIYSCPSDYSDNEKHFIYFNDMISAPVWCSEPTEGKAISPKEFIERIKSAIHRDDYFESQLNLFETLRKPVEIEEIYQKNKLLELVANSFNIVEFMSND